MTRELTITEFAFENKISTSAVYKRIKRKKLKTTQGERNGQECTLIIVEDNGHVQQDPTPVEHYEYNNVQYDNRQVEEAEIISDSVQYNMVSMENTTFDQLITNIKALADDRAREQKEAMDNVQREYFETKAELKTVRDQLVEEKIKAAQSEAEVRILNMQIEEKEQEIMQLKESVEDNKKLKEDFMELKSKYDKLKEDYNKEKDSIDFQLKETESNFWNKARKL